MRLRRVEAEGFLSFSGGVRLDLGPGLTVVTGPNAAGKSNLGRCLDVARAVVGSGVGDDEGIRRLDLYGDAGYEGAREFTVRLGVDLDQDWERDGVRAFVCTCFALGGEDEKAWPVAKLDEAARARLGAGSLDPLCSGELVVRYRAGTRPWSAAWEFADSGHVWHAGVAGEGSGLLRPGPFDDRAGPTGARKFAGWLMSGSSPGAGTAWEWKLPLDFRGAMRETGMAVSFSGSAPSGEVPESVRELAGLLGVEPHNQQFVFGQLLALVLRRGIVLTDNRRLPLDRVFTLAELGREADLRDGAAVAAELFRLKNGPAGDQARFREVQATFRELTGRELELRARPGPEGSSMVVESVVSGFHGERLVELSGAGVQEALVLAALLDDRPGRVTVLDEPAVNLEPTAQRRLLSRVRGSAQYVVITHSADLVPFDEPEDLRRIVRVAPGPGGSQLRRPGFEGVAERRLLRQLQLMEPAEVRGLLFAAGVILCEGQTESGALPRWWRDAGPVGFPGLEAANVPLIKVDGDSGYGPYLRFLDAFGIPWAVLSDGPALRGDSKLAGDLRGLGCWPVKPEPAAREDFAGWRAFWQEAGVFTFADQFGDDGKKGGEFEALLAREDPDLFAEACRVGGSKPRTGRYFALNHPVPPAGVLDVYALIAAHLGLRA